MRQFGIMMGLLLLNLTLATAAEPHKTLTVENFMRRFKISYSVLSMSPDGKRVLSSENDGWVSADSMGPLEKEFKMVILHGHKDDAGSRGLIAKISLHDDGEVTAHIEEYHRKDIDFRYDGKTSGKNPIHIVDQALTDFSAFNYTFKDTGTERTVVRFVPEIMDEKAGKDLKNFPLSGTDMVLFDSKNHIWGARFNVSMPYVSVLSDKGALMMSYNSFEGSEDAGYVEGSIAHINLKDGHQFVLTSSSPMLPTNVVAKIYARFFKGSRKSVEGAYTIATDDTPEQAFKDIQSNFQ